jgi:hypothetical protein
MHTETMPCHLKHLALCCNKTSLQHELADHSNNEFFTNRINVYLQEVLHTPMWSPVNHIYIFIIGGNTLFKRDLL